MKPLKIGIIGYGWVAGAHIEAINATSRGQVVAVTSSRELDGAELSAKHGSEIDAYTDLAEMLAREDIDVVSICSYPNQHREHALAVAAAGKHLIIEKPLALSLAHCQDIATAVKSAGVRACVCFECRFSSQFMATKAVIDQGLLGSIHYGEVDYYHGIGPWYGQFRWNTTKENGGSSLLSAGCHALDALLLCMEGDVLSVTSAATGSRNETFAKYEYPTSSVSILRFSDGRVGKVASVIDCLQPYYFHTHLVGSEGSLLDDQFHSSRLNTDKASWSKLSMKMLDSGDVSDHPYQTQFEAFFEALEDGRDMRLTSLDDAMRSFEVIFAADLSAKENRPVEIAEVRG